MSPLLYLVAGVIGGGLVAAIIILIMRRSGGVETELEKRLGESFKLVSDRLEQVHQGLGAMQQLASDVGGLQKVLTNVKTRGGWSEWQLGVLLEEMLTRDQFATNIKTRDDTDERVEFAIKLPGDENGAPVWLPLDAKFPMEHYERLAVAQEKG